MNQTTLSWRYPLPEPGCGINLGNGTLGLMVWGCDSLIITIGRNGFWDRRNASTLFTEIRFSELRKLLQAGDEKGLEARMEQGGIHPGGLPETMPDSVRKNRIFIWPQMAARGSDS